MYFRKKYRVSKNFVNLFKSEQKHDFKGNFPFRHKNRRMCKVMGDVLDSTHWSYYKNVKLYDKSRLQAQTKLHFAIMICPTIHLNVTQNVPKLKWWWLRSVKNWCKEKKFDISSWSKIFTRKEIMSDENSGHESHSTMRSCTCYWFYFITRPKLGLPSH